MWEWIGEYGWRKSDIKFRLRCYYFIINTYKTQAGNPAKCIDRKLHLEIKGDQCSSDTVAEKWHFHRHVYRIRILPNDVLHVRFKS